MLTDSQTSIEFQNSREYVKNSAYVDDTGAKKFKLDNDDILIDHRTEDFWR